MLLIHFVEAALAWVAARVCCHQVPSETKRQLTNGVVECLQRPRGDVRHSAVWSPGHYVYIGICIGSADIFLIYQGIGLSVENPYQSFTTQDTIFIREQPAS